MPMPRPPIEFAGRAVRRHIRAAIFVPVCAAGLLAGTAVARGYPSRNVGGWTVTASKDEEGCFLTRTYEHPGDTTLLLGLDPDGTNHLSLLNSNWSIRPKERLKLDFHLSGGDYRKHFAVGMRSDGKQGFATRFEARFPAYFAASNVLDVSRGDVPVERLNLDGSGAAVTELRHCVETLRGKPHDVPRDVPRDPFARGPSPDSRK